MRLNRFVACGVSIAALTCALPANAQMQRPLLADSFRLGSGGGVLCQVQSSSRDAAISGIFDRAWAIVCRDAARPIGKLYALRGDAGAIAARLDSARSSEAACSAEGTEAITGLGTAQMLDCRLNGVNVGYRVLSWRKGNTTYVAEGLAGYDSALKLGLQTIIEDRVVPGQVEVATTSVEDPVAFARVQAGTLDPELALAEGYRRNNSGNYAEAAEFFDTLQQRVTGDGKDPERLGEYIVNRALQKSNLGEFAEADTLFAEADKVPTLDRVQSRLRRNFRALHLLNQQRYDDAMAQLDRPVAAMTPITMPGSAIEIGAQVAAEINEGLPVAQRLGATEASALTPDERALILDAQAEQIRGTLLRLKGQPQPAIPVLEKALADVVKVRDGRVVSVTRLKSQIIAETGLAMEDAGDLGGAEAKMRESLALLETRYPQTVAVNGAKARLAAFLARRGRAADAMAIYREVVSSAASSGTATTGIGNLLNPYFELLVNQLPSNPELVGDLFLASQTLVRPGVADTQAILARELSEGSGEAARLFRQARTLSRDIERNRIDLANLTALPDRSTDVVNAMTAVQQDIDTLETQQAATQAQLGGYPQFRALTSDVLTLADLQQTLRAGEAYYKVSVVGRSVYALYATQGEATAWRVPLAADALDSTVDALRNTISAQVNGQFLTYPFDVALSRKLHEALLGPVKDRMAGVKHIIFEPDGALLRLPLNLLVEAQAGVDGYLARQKQAGADEFDFRGVAWLGRTKAVSTAVSARTFRDARTAPASAAKRQYLGLGQNAPVTNAVQISSTRALNSAGGVDCNWPLAEWNKPIADTELRQAQAVVGAGQSTLITGRAFTDTAVVARTDLADYRILHFATHGLVTAPRPECPARPALLTSFGDGQSDGLLSFREIYDLKIDADLVILSACDTAGKATIAATREAGVTTGGGSALDGLVRAFIGAGGRSILASHWPAPDDFNATERLIGGLFRAQPGVSVGEALESAQRTLMDDPATSHPYYWSGFAIIGDGAQQLLTGS